MSLIRLVGRSVVRSVGAKTVRSRTSMLLSELWFYANLYAMEDKGAKLLYMLSGCQPIHSLSVTVETELDFQIQTW